MTKSIITSDELGKQLCNLLELDSDRVSCITITLAAQNPVQITVNMFGDSSINSFDWRSVIDQAVVEIES